MAIEKSPHSSTINTAPTSLSPLKPFPEHHCFTSSTTLSIIDSSFTPIVFPFLINPVYYYFGNPMTSQSYDLIKDQIGSFTPQMSEALEDDPDQYLNSSMLDSVTDRKSVV